MTNPSASPFRGLPVVFGAMLLPVPWLTLTRAGFHGDPLPVSVLTGTAILGAAFLLSWAAELLQIEVSQALALALLALVAVLPEYAVDAVFAFQAGRDPVVAEQGYAVANMTGANRLLVGLGWSLVVLVAWWRHGTRRVVLERDQVLSLGVLLLATLYALVIPFKRELNLLDSAVLLGLFAAYTWATSRLPAEEPHLVGPAATLGALARNRRRLVTLALFAYAAVAIFVSAEPFAHGLVETGREVGIDEFLLVQWLAPLASEAPEFIVALLFVWRGHAAAGLGALVSSKVNQWTLLIATLPLVFSAGAASLGGMPLVARQQQELWLTAAQSLFAVVLIAELALRRWQAVALLVPFIAQLALPPTLGEVDVRLAFTVGYVVAAVMLLLDRRRRAGISSSVATIHKVLRGSAGRPPGVSQCAEESAATKRSGPFRPRSTGPSAGSSA